MPSGSHAGESAHRLVAALPLSCGRSTRGPGNLLMDITSTTVFPSLCGVTTAMRVVCRHLALERYKQTSLLRNLRWGFASWAVTGGAAGRRGLL